MKSHSLVTIVCMIIGFAANSQCLSIIGPKAQAPPDKCPLSKMMITARDFCIARFASSKVGLNIYEEVTQELAALAQNPGTDEMTAFVQKHSDLFLCIIEGTGLVNLESNTLNVDADEIQAMFADVENIDPAIIDTMKEGVETCAETTDSEEDITELLVCVFVVIDKTCEYGFLPNLTAPKAPF